MPKIKEILLAEDIEFDDTDIMSAASAIGMDVDDLNDAEAIAVASKVVELKQTSGLALSKNAQATKGKLGKNSPRRKTTPSL